MEPNNQPTQVIITTLPGSLYITMNTTKTTNNIVYQNTPVNKLGGSCRREAEKIWKDLAHSEARTNMIAALVKDGIGLNEIEEFELGLASKYRSWGNN